MVWDPRAAKNLAKWVFWQIKHSIPCLKHYRGELPGLGASHRAQGCPSKLGMDL